MTLRELLIDNYGWVTVLVVFYLAFSRELNAFLFRRLSRLLRRPSSPMPETTPATADALPTSIDDDWADIAMQLKKENDHA